MDISKYFPKSEFFFKSVDQMLNRRVVYHPREYEHIEEISPFIGKKWQDVDCELLREHYGAFLYFNATAFKYFLPSILCCSLIDFDYVSDACLLLIHCGQNQNMPNRSFKFKDILSGDQLNCFKCWIRQNMGNFSEYLMEDEAEQVILDL